MGLGGFDIDKDGDIDGSSSPLRHAVSNGNFELIRYLVEQGAMLNGALHAACGYRPLDSKSSDVWTTISYLLERGADINGYFIDHTDQCNCTPLYSAILNCFIVDHCLVLIKYLIIRGVDIHKLTLSSGKTLVHAATARTGFKSSVPILQFLHDKGLDLNKVDQNQVSPLQHGIEASYGNEQILLLSNAFLWNMVRMSTTQNLKIGTVITAILHLF